MHSMRLAFTENVTLIANPSKSGGDWWFGKTVKGGRSGLFPKTYVDVIQPGELWVPDSLHSMSPVFPWR
mgnify:CR=1 FL=1